MASNSEETPPGTQPKTKPEPKPSPSKTTNKSALTEEQLEEYREAFSVFDNDGDNSISSVELLTVMRSLGYNPSETEVQGMIREVDLNGNGKIEFDEFCVLMEKKLQSFAPEELIREAFGVIDNDDEGFITLPKLRHIIQDLGHDFTDEEISEMMEEADTTGEGRVNYEDFLNIMTQT